MDNWQYFTSDTLGTVVTLYITFLINVTIHFSAHDHITARSQLLKSVSTLGWCYFKKLNFCDIQAVLTIIHDLSGSCLPQTENKRICQIFGLKKWKKKPKPGFHLKYFYESNGLNFPWFAHITNVLWYFGKRFKNVTNYELNIPSAYCLYCPYKMLLR